MSAPVFLADPGRLSEHDAGSVYVLEGAEARHAGVVQRRGIPAPGHELVGHARHRRDDDRDIVAGIHLAFDVAGDITDAVEIGDGGAAEFHDEARHDVQEPET